jgi:phage gp36-like protein
MKAFKQPSEKQTFTYDFTDDIAAGGTIQSVVAPTPISVPRNGGANLTQDGATSTLPTAVVVKWAGGVAGETYLTTVRVMDSNGEEHERDGEIEVVEQGFLLPTGIAGRYVTAEEYVVRFGQQETVRITDETRSGVVDKGKLETALLGASDLADSYIGRRYTTPLIDTPRVIKTLVGDLAREDLHKMNPPPMVKDAADRARQQLRDIAAGLMTLPVDQGDVEPVIGGNRLAISTGDASTTFRDGVAGFSLDAGYPVANWRR